MARPVDVAGRPPEGLDEGGGRAQEAFLVGVEDGHQRDLGQVQAFAQEVDPDQRVEDALAQVAQDLDPVERLDLGVEIADAQPLFVVVAGQVLGHLLGQGRDQRPLVAAARARISISAEVLDLALDRPDLDLRIDQAGRPDDLLDDPALRPCRSS